MSIRVVKVADVPKKRLNEGVEQPLGGERAAAAVYIAAMVSELAAISRRHDIEALTYILDMARLEAESTVQRLGS